MDDKKRHELEQISREIKLNMDVLWASEDAYPDESETDPERSMEFRERYPEMKYRELDDKIFDKIIQIVIDEIYERESVAAVIGDMVDVFESAMRREQAGEESFIVETFTEALQIIHPLPPRIISNLILRFSSASTMTSGEFLWASINKKWAGQKLDTPKKKAESVAVSEAGFRREIKYLHERIDQYLSRRRAAQSIGNKFEKDFYEELAEGTREQLETAQELRHICAMRKFFLQVEDFYEELAEGTREQLETFQEHAREFRY